MTCENYSGGGGSCGDGQDSRGDGSGLGAGGLNSGDNGCSDGDGGGTQATQHHNHINILHAFLFPVSGGGGR